MATFNIREWLEHGNWQSFALDGLEWVIENAERTVAGTNVTGTTQAFLEAGMKRLALAKSRGEEIDDSLIAEVESDRAWSERNEPEQYAKLLRFVKM